MSWELVHATPDERPSEEEEELCDASELKEALRDCRDQNCHQFPRFRLNPSDSTAGKPREGRDAGDEGMSCSLLEEARRRRDKEMWACQEEVAAIGTD